MFFRKQFQSYQLISLLVYGCNFVKLSLSPTQKKQNPKHYLQSKYKYFCLLSWKIFTKSRLPDPPQSFFEFFLNGEVGELTFCMGLDFRRKSPSVIMFKVKFTEPCPKLQVFHLYTTHNTNVSVRKLQNNCSPKGATTVWLRKYQHYGLGRWLSSQEQGPQFDAQFCIIKSECGATCL